MIHYKTRYRGGSFNKMSRMGQLHHLATLSDSIREELGISKVFVTAMSNTAARESGTYMMIEPVQMMNIPTLEMSIKCGDIMLDKQTMIMMSDITEEEESIRAILELGVKCGCHFLAYCFEDEKEKLERIHQSIKLSLELGDELKAKSGNKAKKKKYKAP